MGWRDRDWARLDESERRSLYAPGSSYRRSSGSAHGLLLAVLVSLALALAVYAVGHFPRGHPLLSQLAFNIPGTATPHATIATSTAEYGSTYSLNGTTPGGANGMVEADGSWNGQPSQVLATATTVAGSYSIQFTITEHGTLKLRVRYPGGEADGTVLVP